MNSTFFFFLFCGAVVSPAAFCLSRLQLDKCKEEKKGGGGTGQWIETVRWGVGRGQKRDCEKVKDFFLFCWGCTALLFRLALGI